MGLQTATVSIALDQCIVVLSTYPQLGADCSQPLTRAGSMHCHHQIDCKMEAVQGALSLCLLELMCGYGSPGIAVQVRPDMQQFTLDALALETEDGRKVSKR